jgi:hypothetical protein
LPLGLAGEQHLVQVACGGGAGDLDSAQRLLGAWVRSGVDVLGEDGLVALCQPREKVVGDQRVVGAVLAVAAVGGAKASGW